MDLSGDHEEIPRIFLLGLDRMADFGLCQDQESAVSIFDPPETIGGRAGKWSVVCLSFLPIISFIC